MAKRPIRNSEARRLHQQKAFRNLVGRGVPGPKEGSEGDLTLRITKKGLRLFAKYRNKWYSFDTLAHEPGGSDGGETVLPIGNKPQPLPHFNPRGNLAFERGTKAEFKSGEAGSNRTEVFQDQSNLRIRPKSRAATAGASIDVVAGDFTVRVDGSLDRTYDTTYLQAGANATGVRISTTSDFANDYLLLTHQAITQANNGTQDFTITADRHLILDAGTSATGTVQLQGNTYIQDSAGNDFAFFYTPASGGTAGNAYFYLYDETGSSSTSRMQIQVASDGETILSTVDNGGTEADFKLDANGNITLDCEASHGILATENGGEFTPSADGHVATKKYVDDNAGGISHDGSTANGVLTYKDADEATVESELTYDSGILSVAHATAQLKLAKDANDYATLTIADTGDLTIATIGDGTTDSDLTLDIDGDIEFNADGGDIAFKDDTADLAALSSSGLTINNISEVGSDTDKFIMSDSGVLKYVTGANLRSYIGAGTGNGDMTGVDLTGGTGISIDSETNTTSGDYSATITCNIEGTEVVSTGETGAVKFLREDGDNTSSWQAPTSFFSWGATMRLIGVVAGDHVAVPTQYDGTTVELGTGTDPNATYTTSTTADHINMRMVQFPQNVRIKSVIASYAQGGSTNTTHNLHLMRYDVDADGDLTNGVVAAAVTNFNSDDYSQRRNSSMTIDTDNDEITTDQCLIGVIEMMTAVNTYISCKFTIEIERY